MLNDGVMILVIFAGLILVPAAVVFAVLAINRSVRNNKKRRYTGVTTGTVVKITENGLNHPWVIQARYCVDNVDYEIKETAKLKTSPIKIGGLPIGQRKTFVLGPLKEGDPIPVHYDEKNPQKAILYGNDGIVTG